MNPLPDISHEDIKRIAKEIYTYNYPIAIIVKDEDHYDDVEKYIKEREWKELDFIMYISGDQFTHGLSPSVLMILDLTEEDNQFPGFEIVDL